MHFSSLCMKNCDKQRFLWNKWSILIVIQWRLQLFAHDCTRFLLRVCKYIWPFDVRPLDIVFCPLGYTSSIWKVTNIHFRPLLSPESKWRLSAISWWSRGYNMASCQLILGPHRKTDIKKGVGVKNTSTTPGGSNAKTWLFILWCFELPSLPQLSDEINDKLCVGATWCCLADLYIFIYTGTTWKIWILSKSCLLFMYLGNST